jgi:hypothetical protein
MSQNESEQTQGLVFNRGSVGTKSRWDTFKELAAGFFIASLILGGLVAALVIR